MHGISIEFFVHYLFFETSKNVIGHVHYDHLLVPGQVPCPKNGQAQGNI